MNILYHGRWNSQFLLFINYVNVTNVVSECQMLVLFIYCCQYGSWSYDYGGVRGSPGPDVVGCYLSFEFW